MTRDLYRLASRAMLACYPSPFKRRFAADMLATYDLAANECSQRLLLSNLLFSLLRQWIEWGCIRNRDTRAVPQTVLGSVLTGEYPAVGANIPSTRRLVQGALVVALLWLLALNLGVTYRSLLQVGSFSVIALPDTYEHKLLPPDHIHPKTHTLRPVRLVR